MTIKLPGSPSVDVASSISEGRALVIDKPPVMA